MCSWLAVVNRVLTRPLDVCMYKTKQELAGVISRRNLERVEIHHDLVLVALCDTRTLKIFRGLECMELASLLLH